MTRSLNAPAPAYEKDLAAWLEDQARRARRGKGLDLENNVVRFRLSEYKLL